LSSLLEANVDVLLVCADREARPFRLGTSPRTLAKLAASGHFRFEFLPDLGHGLLSEADRDLVGTILTEHVLHHFGQNSANTGHVAPFARSGSSPPTSATSRAVATQEGLDA
jgi:hypothetical protein